MYYRAHNNSGTICDALDGLQCVRFFANTGMILRCRQDDEPMGIISTDGVHLWHVEGWPEFPAASGWEDDEVTLTEISQEEYEEIRAALDAGNDYTIFNEDPDDEAPETPTPAQRLAKLEEQLKIAARYASV